MPIAPATIRNRLLRSLPASELEQLLPQMRRVDMSLGDVLIRPGLPIDSAYFPESGWVSLIVSLEEGDGAEVGLAGREGMVGVPLVFGVDQSVQEAMVQAAGQPWSSRPGRFAGRWRTAPCLASCSCATPSRSTRSSP